MKIDEAIESLKLDYEIDMYIHDIAPQLAEWLEELKMYKSLAPRELVSEKQKNDRATEYSKGFDYGFKTGYAKAIDDFAEKVKEMYAFTILEEEQLNEIAEQLKAGDTDAGN